MALYQKLQELLIKAGMSESEALLYKELLKKPAHTAYDLAKRTGLPKTTVYRAYERLKELRMVEKDEQGIRALSPKVFVAELMRTKRNLAKTAYSIRLTAPFLRTPQEVIEEFETLYTQDQIAEAYVNLADQDYDVSLDIGDFEGFVPVVGGIELPKRFRERRLKNLATNHAICTSPGPFTSYFCTDEAKKKFKNFVQILRLNFAGNFTCFSDRNDYVLFNHFTDPENPMSVLVKSKVIADTQRMLFRELSRAHGNA